MAVVKYSYDSEAVRQLGNGAVGKLNYEPESIRQWVEIQCCSDAIWQRGVRKLGRNSKAELQLIIGNLCRRTGR